MHTVPADGAGDSPTRIVSAAAILPQHRTREARATSLSFLTFRIAVRVAGSERSPDRRCEWILLRADSVRRFVRENAGR